MALEIVVDHLRPDTFRLDVTDEFFTRHSWTLLAILTHGCHPPTRLSQALGIRLTEELMIPRMPIDLHLQLSDSNERHLWQQLATTTTRVKVPPSPLSCTSASHIPPHHVAHNVHHHTTRF